MADISATDKILAAITSTEALAAFLGAFAAFLLEAIRRWRSERLANLAAGNEAVFALSQMYTWMTNVNNQMFVDRAAEVRAETGRDPLYIYFLPMEARSEDVLRVPMDRLGFLLSSYEPDMLNRIAACDREFGVLSRLLEQRNAIHVEWQQRSGQITAQLPPGTEVTLEQMENAVGGDLSHRLKAMTESLQKGLPACAGDLRTVATQLTFTLSMVFPTKRVTEFEAIPREKGLQLPAAARPPRLWRRFVRRCFRIARTPIRLPGKAR
jgi:hypothetical protein